MKNREGLLKKNKKGFFVIKNILSDKVLNREYQNPVYVRPQTGFYTLPKEAWKAWKENLVT